MEIEEENSERSMTGIKDNKKYVNKSRPGYTEGRNKKRKQTKKEKTHEK